MIGTISMTLLWLIIFALLIIVELVTMGLTTIWFAGGAVVACVLAALSLPIWLQVVVFLVVSVVLLYFTRPIAVKYFNKSRVRTNIESMIGKQAVVMSESDNIQGIGQVKVNGMDWSARSFDGTPIEAGKVVVVRAVDGVKLIVSLDPNNN